MGEIKKVGIAEMDVCSSPDAITTLGLGSCVGVAVFDPVMKIGGLVHVMLPDSTAVKNNTNIAKFADTGVRELIRLLEKKGVNRSRLKAKIAGGAQMFAFNTTNDAMRVGDRNVEASKRILQQLRIPLVAEDTGKNYGRTVIFYPENGDFVIKAVGKPEKTI